MNNTDRTALISIKVLFFATLRDRTGVKEVEIEMPEYSSVGELKSLLENLFPGLQPHMPNVLVSINREFAFDSDLILASAEIALFPPVSGG